MDGRFLEKKPTIEYVRNRAIVEIENGKISFSQDFEIGVKILTERMSRKIGSTGKRKRKAST